MRERDARLPPSTNPTDRFKIQPRVEHEGICAELTLMAKLMSRVVAPEASRTAAALPPRPTATSYLPSFLPSTTSSPSLPPSLPFRARATKIVIRNNPRSPTNRDGTAEARTDGIPLPSRPRARRLANVSRRNALDHAAPRCRCRCTQLASGHDMTAMQCK